MKVAQSGFRVGAIAVLISAGAAPADSLAQPAQGTQPQQSASQQTEQKLSPEQLQSMLAPIALYPDPLLAQVLAASTYPLETIEAEQWLKRNSSLKGENLVKAAAEKNWDPSIQALVVFPDILKKMSGNLEWTTAVGNALLAQQQDVMTAIQALRQKAYASNSLTSNSQQKVDVETQQGQTIIKIEPADPQVVYVPSYNPAVVYGPAEAAYPYPAMVYPPAPYGGAAAASAISFGVGVALGAAFHGCCGPYGWGWNTNWGAHNVTINNAFVNHYGLSGTRNVSGTTAWAHNPAYRGAVPYSNAAVAARYGGAGAAGRTAYGAGGAARTGAGGAARTMAPGVARTVPAAPSGSAQRFGTPQGSVSGLGGARPGEGLRAPVPSADRSALSTGRGGDWQRSSSARGNSSLSGARGGFGGGAGGGFRGGGGGFRGGGRGRR